MMNPIVISLCAAAALGGAALLLVGGDSRAEKRRTAVAKPTARTAGISAQAEKAARRKQIADGLKDLEKAHRRRESLRSRIEQAGLPLSPMQFVTACIALGLVAGAALWLETGTPLLAALLAVIGAVGVPRVVLSQMRKRRTAKFIGSFPAAIDIIVRGVKSGLPLGDTIRMVATETDEPVRGEFRRVAEAASIGLTLPEAVERMAQRVPVAETNFFSIVISIQGQAGGSLSDALGNLSRVLRERKKMREKISAMSMEAKASAVIIGAVPFLVVGALYISSPKYVSLLWTTWHGRLIAGITIGWMSIGVAMMKKMISFDI
jgi:tight adherence protein B